MNKCQYCHKPLILSGGKCLYCGKAPGEKEPERRDEPVKIFWFNGVSVKMILVEGGTFWMGAQRDDPQGQNYDPDCDFNEGPVHKVTLSSYYLGETMVTQSLWKAVGGGTFCDGPEDWGEEEGKGDSYPVFNVYESNIIDFIDLVNETTGLRFRLPTEAEWEFAARGGNRSRNSRYAGSNHLDDVGWYWKNSGDRLLIGTDSDWDGRKIAANNCRVRPVKEKTPNELGLYDMSGNLYEMCQDFYGPYESHPQSDPWGPAGGIRHVMRGGCWYSFPSFCRVSYRVSYVFGAMGFRLCLPV